MRSPAACPALLDQHDADPTHLGLAICTNHTQQGVDVSIERAGRVLWSRRGAALEQAFLLGNPPAIHLVIGDGERDTVIDLQIAGDTITVTDEFEDSGD